MRDREFACVFGKHHMKNHISVLVSIIFNVFISIIAFWCCLVSLALALKKNPKQVFCVSSLFDINAAIGNMLLFTYL